MTIFYMSIKDSRKKHAFTIVEILIVLAVIGILASLSMVAYNGIQNSAAATVLQSDLEQASAELERDRTLNGVYPASIAAANNNQGIEASPGTTYQYTYTPSTDTYCLTATSDRTGIPAFYISTSTNTIREGACAGHSGGDGLAPISPIAYEAGFEILDFWEARPSTNSNVYMNDDEAGNRVLALYGGAGSMQVYADREVTGLTIGAQYTISVQAAVEGTSNSPRTAYVGIDGIGLSNGVVVASSGGEFIYSPVSFNFTATNTAHTMVFAVDSVDAWGARFNDVTLEGPGGISIYSHDFDFDSSWTNVAGFQSYARTGSYAMLSNSGSSQTMTRLVSGLYVGDTYIFTAWVRNSPFWSSTASIGVTGIGATTPILTVTDTYQELSYEFKAIATEHTLELNNLTGQTLWDDIIVVRQ